MKYPTCSHRDEEVAYEVANEEAPPRRPIGEVEVAIANLAARCARRRAAEAEVLAARQDLNGAREAARAEAAGAAWAVGAGADLPRFEAALAAAERELTVDP